MVYMYSHSCNLIFHHLTQVLTGSMPKEVKHIVALLNDCNIAAQAGGWNGVRDVSI